MTLPLQLWDVYHLVSKHTNPPKPKFVVLMYIDPMPMAFFINSAMNNFVLNRPRLHVCHVPILQADHGFLAHDSFIDCQDVYPYPFSELTNWRGSIHPTARAAVLQAVILCPVLPRQHKIAIAAANLPPTPGAI